jgi:hypothetical protein
MKAPGRRSGKATRGKPERATLIDPGGARSRRARTARRGA